MFKVKDEITKDTVFFDVDDTLVEWIEPTDERAEQCTVVDGVLLLPIIPHMNALIAHKKRGDVVVVWSQGGADWCEKVVKAFNLEQYVDVLLNKPTWYYDDLHCTQWLTGKRIFKPNEENTLPDQFEI